MRCWSPVHQHELAEQAHEAEAALRESEERLALELAATQQLQGISTQMIQEGNVEALYEEILDAANVPGNTARGLRIPTNQLENATERRVKSPPGQHPERVPALIDDLQARHVGAHDGDGGPSRGRA